MRVWRKCSIESPEALVVLREVIIVLIWYSMNPIRFWVEVMKLSGQYLVQTKIRKRVQSKREVHCQRKIIWVYHIGKKGLASIALGCQGSWNKTLYLKGYLPNGSAIRK